MERCAANIDLDRLTNNYSILGSIGSHSYKVMAVVKANAYGHGSIHVSKHLESFGCQQFGVASLEEAIELRENKIHSMILIFGRTNPSEAKKLSINQITQTVDSLEYAKELSALNYPLEVHINIDTGMSRFGIYCHREENIPIVAEQIKEIVSMPNLKITGIYTHFEGAENEDRNHTEKQFNVFTKLLSELEKRKIKVGVKHACNSSATINFPEMHLDMVRCGIALYGYPPVKTRLKFQPVMEVVSKVVAIHDLTPGDTVSYGAKFTATKNTRVATVAIGYADGYPRAMTNNDYVLFKDIKLPVIGSVCMDAIMVDISNVEIEIGEEVIIFGREKTVEIIAQKLGTISYEILCNVGKRVDRIYIKMPL